MTDAYDDAISAITANTKNMGPAEFQNYIIGVWTVQRTRFGGCLFSYTGNLGSTHRTAEGALVSCGCLTQVKKPNFAYAFGPSFVGDVELLAEIQRDARIPDNPGYITVENLHAFADYQRRIDAVLDRPAPIWNGCEYVRDKP